jgi:hypothetical protein
MERDQAAAVRRWDRGHELVAARSRELTAREGPRPAQAVAETLLPSGHPVVGILTLAVLLHGCRPTPSPSQLIGGEMPPVQRGAPLTALLVSRILVFESTIC